MKLYIERLYYILGKNWSTRYSLVKLLDFKEKGQKDFQGSRQENKVIYKKNENQFITLARKQSNKFKS